MKLTPEDYRRHRRELNDDEFPAINRDDLVDAAHRCYDGESLRLRLPPQPRLIGPQEAEPAP
jgi:hypothetical protein